MSDHRNPNSSMSNDAKKVDDICQEGDTECLIERYVDFCLSEDPKRLPNIAGFFRWLKLSATAMDHFKSAHPDDYRTLKMILEDEALNSSRPPSIVSAYIKQYFSYDGEEISDDRTGITLLFEHDIKRDGE